MNISNVLFLCESNHYEEFMFLQILNGDMEIITMDELPSSMQVMSSVSSIVYWCDLLVIMFTKKVE